MTRTIPKEQLSKLSPLVTLPPLPWLLRDREPAWLTDLWL